MLRRRFNFFLVLVLVAVVLFMKSPSEWLSSGRSSKRRWQRNPQVVPRKSDLLHVDISQELNQRDWDLSPVNLRTIKQKYEDEEIVGFVSNLDVKKVLEKKARTAKNHDYDGVLKGTLSAKEYQDLITCPDLAYRSKIQHSANKKLLKDDLAALRYELITNPSFLSKEVTGEDEQEMSVPDIIHKKWFQFGSSAVWLESEQCYVVYSRVIYSSVHVRNRPHVSLVRAQAFDKDWNELKDKWIPYVDVPLGKDMDRVIKEIDDALGITDCSALKSNHAAYDACMVENTKNSLEAKRRRESILSRYYMKYPTILNIPFKTDGDWKGPEDPKVVLRKTDQSEEPVVLYNIHDDDLDRRIMVAYMPHRKIEPMVKLSVNGREQRGMEKNWTPFFHHETGESVMSRGFIHFIYSFSPLEILKCSLNDGICSLVFDADTLKVSDANKFDGIRGGTQYIPLPAILPRVSEDQIWIGFPKQHIENCGCGDFYYRPMLGVLVERHGVYSQELMVPALGFNMDVLSWDLQTTECKDTNILSPNSIGYWEVVRQDPQTKKYEDYLTLTVSEADSNTKVITLKGVLNFVLGVYQEKDIKEKFEIDDQSDSIVGHTLHCLVHSAFDQCKSYGEAHPGPAEGE
ncbi:hypothetical protein HG536_0A00200 [Torulaspora globosa]|uniref:Uncharacterized protein n=1 Tax=Torulaspora globosa TaxID=48254 RepID=A0A7G3Z9L7_9SACH|nr:uncharacterized protein HG536_0A00200 [Torulaspora globosa]QLL30203.1 hypothetical protein HG536_0A00200 [Torulaspora globosa]